MSIISMLGGVEAEKLAELDQRLNDISLKFDAIDEALTKLMNKWSSLDMMCNTQHMDLMALQNNYQKTTDRIEEMNNALKIANASLRSSETINAVNAIDKLKDVERMQTYFMSSHGKALNDISDLKKELFELYGRLKPASTIERAKSVDPNPEDLSLIDYIKQDPGYQNLDQRARGTLMKALRAAEVTDISFLKDKSYEDFWEMPYVGPYLAGYLCSLRDKFYKPVTHRLKTTFIDNNIRTAMNNLNVDRKMNTRIAKILETYGVTALSDLRKLDYEEVCKIPKFGKGCLEIVHKLYETYIWE